MADIKKIALPDGTSYDIGNLIEISLTWSNNIGTLRDYTNWGDIVNGTHIAGQSTIYFFRYIVGGKSLILFSTSYTSGEFDTIFCSQPDENGYIYKGTVQRSGNTVTINSYTIYPVPGDDGSVADGDILTATVSTSGQTRTFSYGWQTPSPSSSNGVVYYETDGSWSGEGYYQSGYSPYLFTGYLLNNKTLTNIRNDISNGKLPIITIPDISGDYVLHCYPNLINTTTDDLDFFCMYNSYTDYAGIIIIHCYFISSNGVSATTNIPLPDNGVANGLTLRPDDNNNISWQQPIRSIPLCKTYANLTGPVICFTKDEQNILPITSYNTTSTKILTTTSFDPFGNIYYYDWKSSADNVAAGDALQNEILYNIYNSNINLAYSFNLSPLSSNKNVYIVCTPGSNGQVTLASSPLAQTLPTTADGKIYILLGKATGALTCLLSPNKTIYYYSNGALRVWTNPDPSGGSGLPSVTSSDNGKFLRVVNGAWAAATVPDANGVSF